MHPSSPVTKLLDNLLQEKSLSIASLACPHLFRYVSAALILHKRLKHLVSSTVWIIDHEALNYSDPITRFMRALFIDIDSEKGRVVMSKAPPSVYQQVIEKTKNLSFRSTMLLANLEKLANEQAAQAHWWDFWVFVRCLPGWIAKMWLVVASILHIHVCMKHDAESQCWFDVLTTSSITPYLLFVAFQYCDFRLLFDDFRLFVDDFRLCFDDFRWSFWICVIDNRARGHFGGILFDW